MSPHGTLPGPSSSVPTSAAPRICRIGWPVVRDVDLSQRRASSCDAVIYFSRMRRRALTNRVAQQAAALAALSSGDLSGTPDPAGDPELSQAEPGDDPGLVLPSSARQKPPGEPGHVRIARTTIPIGLSLGVLLPLLGVGWFLLPRSAALKLGGAWLAFMLMTFGLLFLLAAWALMWSVSRHYQARGGAGTRFGLH